VSLKSNARMYVAKSLLENGISVKGSELYVNSVKIPTTSVAKALGVDRRVVTKTIQEIQDNPRLRQLFMNIRDHPSTFLENYETLEITFLDHSQTVEVMSHILYLMAKYGINIRNIVLDDPIISPDPKLTIATYQPVSGEIIDEMKVGKNVRGVTVYKRRWKEGE